MENPKPEDISQLFETQKAIDNAISKKQNNWSQTIATLLMIVTMAVGAAIWTGNAHAEIKDWTSEQDFVTKKELKEVIKEQYVRKEEFVKVEQKLENLNEKHERLMETLDKMDAKLDRLEVNISSNRYSRNR